jgi:hypothetical protein
MTLPFDPRAEKGAFATALSVFRATEPKTAMPRRWGGAHAARACVPERA